MLPLAQALSSPGPGLADELSALAELGIDTRFELAEIYLGTDPSSLDPGSSWLVRTPWDAEPSRGVLLASLGAPGSLDRGVFVSTAAALLGVTPSRVEASFPVGATGAQCVAIMRGLLAPLGTEAPDLEDFASVAAKACARLVRRSGAGAAGRPEGPWIAERLEPGARYGYVLSRDLRTGALPRLAQLTDDVRAALEPLGRDGPLSELRVAADVELEARVRAELDRVAEHLEQALLCPVRLGFRLSGDRVAIRSVAPERRSAHARPRLLAELVERGRIERRAALGQVEPASLALRLRLEPTEESATVCTGVAAGGGVAQGLAALSPEQALELASHGLTPILVVHELEAEDGPAVRASVGVIATRGGITGEAAVMCRALGKPCVAAAGALTLSGEVASDRSGNSILFGDRIAMDGQSGLIVAGPAALRLVDARPEVAALLGWADAARPRRLLASVLSSDDVVAARELGADGIALVASEAMLVFAQRAADPRSWLAAQLSAVRAVGDEHGLGVWVRRPDPARHVLGGRLGERGQDSVLIDVFLDIVSGFGWRSIVDTDARPPEGELALRNVLALEDPTDGHAALVWDDGSDPMGAATAVLASERRYWLSSLPRLPLKRVALGRAASARP